MCIKSSISTKGKRAPSPLGKGWEGGMKYTFMVSVFILYYR